jgi:hypothetical protein
MQVHGKWCSSSTFSSFVPIDGTLKHWRTEGGGRFGGVKPPPPRNSEVLTKLSRIPSSVENASVTTLDIPKV